MRRIAFIVLLSAASTAAHAQSLSDQFNQATQYVGQKAADTKQYIQQNNPYSGNQSQQPNGKEPGQVPFPAIGQGQNGNR